MSASRIMPDDFEPPTYHKGKPMPQQYQLAYNNPGRWIEFEVPDRDAVQLARVYVSQRRGRLKEQWELRSSVNSTTAHVRFTPKVEP